jgi:hypothetical protein
LLQVGGVSDPPVLLEIGFDEIKITAGALRLAVAEKLHLQDVPETLVVITELGIIADQKELSCKDGDAKYLSVFECPLLSHNTRREVLAQRGVLKFSVRIVQHLRNLCLVILYA